MRAVKKFAIIASVVAVLFIGAWTYACCANLPFVSDMARGATHTVALSMGMHVFDPPAATTAEAKKDTVANLPEGFYLYVGERPAHSAPKWVVVNPGGTINWIADETAPAAAGGAVAPGTMKAAAAAGAVTGEWKEKDYDYPHIKWNPKSLPHTNGGIAQLETTYETGENGRPGVLKYQVLVLKDPSKRNHQIQLLDKDGFKIFSFPVGDWQDVADSEFMEARDEVTMSEDDYRRVRRYTIN